MRFKFNHHRREAGKAVPFFIAIHGEKKSLGVWKKRNGAH
jgi:hypothetical protein